MRLTEDEHALRCEALMRMTLQLAVPMWITKVRDWTPREREYAAHNAGRVVAEQGDTLQYRTKGTKRKNGDDETSQLGTARVFNELAKGIACAAFSPGGVTFLGDHWEETRQ